MSSNIMMENKPIITLLTDFGFSDPYVASMKGVILSICPKATIIDITHQIPKFNIKTAAFVLMQTVKWFPPKTINVVVVDPGVGTSRRAIIVEGKRHFYVGPDNGVLIPSALREGIKNVYVIENRRFMLKEISRTFHGRDIFAPTAAYLASGFKPSDFGSKIEDYVRIKLRKAKRFGNTLSGEIIYVDGFGNLITSISAEDLKDLGVFEGDILEVKLGGKTFKLKFCSAYGEVEVGRPLAIIDSFNLLEIAINQGSASNFFGVNINSKIRVSVKR